jgi:topoisomerase-4 subunit A
LVLDLANLIDVKGLKANGNRVSQHEVKAVLLVDAGNEIGTEMVDFNQASADVEVQVNEVTPKEKSEENADTVLVEEIVVDSEASEITDPDLPAEVLVKKKPVFKTEKIEDPADKKVVKPVLEEVVEEIKAPEKPVEPKRVDFEITNPDDIKIDDKGQSLLF